MLRPLILAVVTAALSACAAMPVGNPAVPQPAKPVELSRYVGRWYELARYENRFERGCEGVTAEYSLRPDGDVKVVNTCREGAPQGEARQSVGKAKVVEPVTGAKLKVSFFGPIYGDYWVLDRAEDYSWSIVGEPSGKYLWILARSPDPGQLPALRERARTLGYDLTLLRPTAQ